jgi:hypothetical protein
VSKIPAIVLMALVVFLMGEVPRVLAAEVSVEQSMRQAAGEILAVTARAMREQGGRLDAEERVTLQTLHTTLQAGHLLMTERWRRHGALLQGGVAGEPLQRHRLAVARYQAIMDDLLPLVRRLSLQTIIDQEAFAALRTAAGQLTPPRSRALHGLLPYGPPEHPAPLPVKPTPFTPAYRLTTVVPATAADLAAAPEAPISRLIVDQAQAIAALNGRPHWDPAAIYNWVRSNIRTEWYFGSMKGAEETLRQGGGNAADQAALLIALLRASGYPARYVRGVVEFFPGLEAATAMTGIADPEQLLDFFQTAGIPCEPVYRGGAIVNLRIEHLWVEALVPYANYRGVVADTGGQLWVPLDTTIKTGAAEQTMAIDLAMLPDNPLPGFRERYLERPRAETPLEQLASEVAEFLGESRPGTTFADLLHIRRQPQAPLEILPGSLQFSEVAVTAGYAALPAELVHQVRLTASVAGQGLFDVSLPLHRLSNRRVMIGFEPETVADQELINRWGGLDNTPAYLLRLRPTLLIDDQLVAFGSSGLVPGEEFSLAAEFVGPNGTVAGSDQVMAGYPLLLGIVAGKALPPARYPQAARAEDWLHRTVLAYIAAWDSDEERLADLFDVALARPLPAYVVVGGMLRSEALAGVVLSAEWEGLFIDANLRRAVAVARQGPDPERIRDFFTHAALAGSVHEERVFAEEFGVAGISTALLLALAGEQEVPLLTIDDGNAANLLPALNLDADILADVTSAIAAGLRVLLPAAPVSHQAWQGIGYLKEDPAIGAAGYMLSGGLAGGQTVLGRRDWPAAAEVLARPFTGPPNEDPAQAFALIGVTPPQLSLATAGEELPAPVMALVRDAAGVPVAAASVTFTVRSGGGWLLDESQSPALPVAELTVASGRDGIARARFVPGEQTSANPVIYVREGDRHANIVGENLLDARLLSGSLAKLATPIAIFGFAGLPDPLLSKVFGNNQRGEVFSYSGDALLLLKDRFGNPVANHPVSFSVGAVQPVAASRCQNLPDLPAVARDASLLGDDPCRMQTPVHGECAAAAGVEVVSRSDGGALAGVVLGGVPYAAYPIRAEFAAAAGPHSVTWTHHSNPFASCVTTAAPESRLILTYQLRQDESGRNVDARPAGRLSAVQVKSYLLAEEAAIASAGQTLSCAALPPLTCDLVAGNGAFTLAAPGEVLIDGRPAARAAPMNGSQVLPWLYRSEVDFSSGLVEVSAEATAVRTVPRIVNDCSGCGTMEPAAALDIGPVRRTVPIWGVAVDGPPAVTVLVDGQGIAQRDLRFNFVIEPAAYVANQSQVLLYRNGELWDTLPAGRSGAAAVTFPAGYWFDPQASYELQVLLNNAGEANQIWSKRIPLLQRTAAVDLRIDGLPDAVEDRIGAFVLVNNDFDESDADPEGGAPDLDTPAIVTTDDELKRAWLQIDDSSGAGGSWRIRASDPTRLRIYHLKDGRWVTFGPDDPPEPIDEFPALIPVYLEGLAESAAIHSDSLTATFFPDGSASVSDTVPVTVLDLDLAVDGNRDRLIDPRNRGDEQLLFWVNNDRDYLHSEDGQPVEDDAESGDDSIDTVISCKRDLEDFARLHLLLGAVARPGPLTYTLQVVADDEKIQPLLNIFPAVNLSDGYLGLPGEQSTPDQPDQQIRAKLLIAVGELPTILPSDKIESNKTNYFLLEGRMPGKGQLVLTASYQGLPVATRAVGLELVDMSWFYDHFVVSQSGAKEDSPVRPAVNPEGMLADSSRLARYQPAASEYVLFVHGWNMQGWEKRRWAETLFKRLWWQGYQGKVGLFDWPCRTLPSWDFLVNYDRSEYIAWQSATALNGVLTQLQRGHAGQVRVLAHSQGNVVAGEALRQGEPGLVHTYVASQAALSAGFYGTGDFDPKLSPITVKTPDVVSKYPQTVSGRPYLEGVTAKAGATFNYYNLSDYALTGNTVDQPTWELNNLTRPDGSHGYGYQGDLEVYPPPAESIGFYHDSSLIPFFGTRRTLQLPRDAHEVFSFSAQSRTRALGAVRDATPVFDSALDLLSFGYGAKRYSHSRQFRSNVIAEQGYWQRFMDDIAAHSTWRKEGGI